MTSPETSPDTFLGQEPGSPNMEFRPIDGWTGPSPTESPEGDLEPLPRRRPILPRLYIPWSMNSKKIPLSHELPRMTRRTRVRPSLNVQIYANPVSVQYTATREEEDRDSEELQPPYESSVNSEKEERELRSAFRAAFAAHMGQDKTKRGDGSAVSSELQSCSTCSRRRPAGERIVYSPEPDPPTPWSNTIERMANGDSDMRRYLERESWIRTLQMSGDEGFRNYLHLYSHHPLSPIDWKTGECSCWWSRKTAGPVHGISRCDRNGQPYSDSVNSAIPSTASWEDPLPVMPNQAIDHRSGNEETIPLVLGSPSSFAIHKSASLPSTASWGRPVVIESVQPPGPDFDNDEDDENIPISQEPLKSASIPSTAPWGRSVAVEPAQSRGSGSGNGEFITINLGSPREREVHASPSEAAAIVNSSESAPFQTIDLDSPSQPRYDPFSPASITSSRYTNANPQSPGSARHGTSMRGDPYPRGGFRSPAYSTALYDFETEYGEDDGQPLTRTSLRRSTNTDIELGLSNRTVRGTPDPLIPRRFAIRLPSCISLTFGGEAGKVWLILSIFVMDILLLIILYGVMENLQLLAHR